MTSEGRKAVALGQWQGLNPERLKYELVFAREDAVGYDQLAATRAFVEGRSAPADNAYLTDTR